MHPAATDTGAGDVCTTCRSTPAPSTALSIHAHGPLCMGPGRLRIILRPDAEAPRDDDRWADGSCGGHVPVHAIICTRRASGC